MLKRVMLLWTVSTNIILAVIKDRWGLVFKSVEREREREREGVFWQKSTQTHIMSGEIAHNPSTITHTHIHNYILTHREDPVSFRGCVCLS